MSDKPVIYKYRFRFASGEEKLFVVALDTGNSGLLAAKEDGCPEWAALGFNKCPCCPLDEKTDDFCPAALSLAELVNAFKSSLSFEDVEVSIETDERTYLKRTTLQKGLSPLIGIYMAASGCPVMEKLRPMARYHLPFATEDETKYRVFSMYLLAQFLRSRRGKAPDWEMKGLVKIYEDVRVVNSYIAKRLTSIKIEDANINALIILDCFADSVKFSINRDALEDIEELFGLYLR
ncbi:MAG: hypothetical protein EPN22_14680 [Nitrospirae bacterium]|nr:MAG: hypothetical protein EPN22_14680 [Nitrospirota bacterium]